MFNPTNFKRKLQQELSIIDYHLKDCMVGQKCKINITGRKRYVGIIKLFEK
jgi:hypothetical protein